MRNAGMDEAWAGIKIVGRNIKNLRPADDTTLMAESKEELKSPLMTMIEESEQAGLKLNIQKWRSWYLVPSLHGKWMGKQCKQRQTLFWGAPKSLQIGTAVMKLKDACSLEETNDKPWQCIKKQRHYFASKGQSSQSYGFSISHVWMWKLDNKKKVWVLKNWCLQTAMLKKSLESLGQQEDQTSLS